jgi:hypothetical protein
LKCFFGFFGFFLSISIVRSTTYMQNLVVMDTTKGPVDCLFFDHFAVGDRNVQCVAREGGYSLIVEIQDLIPRENPIKQKMQKQSKKSEMQIREIDANQKCKIHRKHHAKPKCSSINRQSCNHARSPIISHNVSRPSLDQKEKSAPSSQTETVLVSAL